MNIPACCVVLKDKSELIRATNLFAPNRNKILLHCVLKKVKNHINSEMQTTSLNSST